ncbi:MAG: TIGR00374 family protein [Chloroflexi bacterium RBG_16_57_11]|nr:MAG: TIGR00374 family protein [Chloroflexi bacterium RBG_16_57_11]
MKRWQFWVGVFISLVLIWYSLRGLNIKELADVLAHANYWWLVPGVAVYFVAVWARAWRWHYLLKPLKPIQTNQLFPTVCIGYFGNNILPARAGELLRAAVLKKDEEIAISASLATIIIERVFDGVVMLGFVFINLSELARLTQSSGFIGDIRTLALIGTGIFLGALAVFLGLAMYPERSLALVEQIVQRLIPEKFAVKILGLADRFLGGLASLRSPRTIFMVFVISVVIWLLETAKYWFVMHAFPFEVSFFALMLMNGIVNLATTIPSAPGYVGTFDAPGIAVLQAYAVPKTIAAAYTLALHAALWAPVTLVGGYYMLRKGIRWSEEIERAKAEV